jgi:hypothetical protein
MERDEVAVRVPTVAWPIVEDDMSACGKARSEVVDCAGAPQASVGTNQVPTVSVSTSVPQTTFPFPSVSRSPEQEMSVAILRPPPVRARPFTVEVAVVALRDVVCIPPANVVVAVEVEVRDPTVSRPMVEEETSSLTKATGDEVAEYTMPEMVVGVNGYA